MRTYNRLSSLALVVMALMISIPALAQGFGGNRPPGGFGGGRPPQDQRDGQRRPGPRGNFKGEIVLENIASRKSVRTYTGKSVSKDTLEILVKAGMAAPSGMNKQPWEFIAVNKESKIKKIAQAMGRTGGLIKEAGSVIVVCGIPDESKLWMLDCAAAAENILLAAEALGLGAVWTAAWPYEDRIAQVKEAFGIPENVVPLCVIPVGHSEGEQQVKDKWNKKKYHVNEW